MVLWMDVHQEVIDGLTEEAKRHSIQTFFTSATGGGAVVKVNRKLLSCVHLPKLLL